MKNVAFATLTLALVSISPAFAGEPVPFETAYQNAKATGRPVIAVLGAEWCPACVVLKKQTIPEALRRGGLQNVELTHVDIDRQKEIAAKLQAGPMIPQVVKMTWKGKAWDIKRLPGALNVKSVEDFAKAPITNTNPMALPLQKERSVPQNSKLIASVQ